MNFRKITDDLSVSPQIGVADVAAAAAAGFRSIICNRPDGEAGDQPAFAAIEAAAKAAGLAIVYQPVQMVSPADAVAFAANSAALPTPILAYCRSGTRCATLWTIAEAPNRSLDDLVARTSAAGYDMSAVAARAKG
jgi:sulfide:quinone oxidoreductase